MDGTVLNGEDLYSLFTNGYRNLKQNASIVDALNVFPIPDGDTGKNMSMTWLGGIENVDKEEKSAGKINLIILNTVSGRLCLCQASGFAIQ